MLHKKSFFTILFLVLIVLLGLLLASQGFASEDMSITVVERATTDVVTDLATEGDSVGDMLTFANELYDAENAEKVGTDNGYCVRTAVGVAWECAWTATLADGQIMVAGSFMDAGDSLFAIVGGTGAYIHATGQMTLHPRNPEGSEYDFTYEINAPAN